MEDTTQSAVHELLGQNEACTARDHGNYYSQLNKDFRNGSTLLKLAFSILISHNNS